MYCLMEMVAVIREKIASSFVTNLDWVKVHDLEAILFHEL